uniref:Uncharacterized protein n=1 Tax=Daphnia galeata TaxID=27404 RepID=A0A8J2WCK5_9CRUS|nr:unnamed protein product [Daphnia galeata]
MLNVIFDADDEVTLSCSTAPRYLVNSSAVCQAKCLSLNSGSPCWRICYVQVVICQRPFYRNAGVYNISDDTV